MVDLELNIIKSKNGEEVWKPIQGYELSFEVSNLGRIRSLDRIVTDKNGVVKSLKGGVKTLNRKEGYQRVVLYKDGKKGKGEGVHRLVAKAFIPNPENKPQVNHIDGNKQNNCLYNLEWCTASENSQWSYDIGLQLKGECHSQSKLSNSQVIEICNLLDEGLLSRPEIAEIYGVESTTIRKIHFGEVWNHLTNRKGRFKVSSRKGAEHIRSRKVRNCRGEIYDTVTEASAKYNTTASNISKVCSGKRGYAGKYKDGDPVKWVYDND